MANETVIKTLIFRGTSEGVDTLTKQTIALAGALDDVTVASEQQAKATLSVEAAYKRLQSRYDEAFRAQNALAGVQKTLNTAVAQGFTTQDRANELMQQAIIYHNKTGDAQARMTDTTKLARYELINLSRQVQDVGVSLASGQAPLTVFIQQGSQIADVFASSQATLKGFASQVTSGLAAVFQPARVAVGAVAAFGIAAVVATEQWLSAQRQIQLSLLGIGRAAGVTVGDINKLAAANSSLTGLSTSQAAIAASALAATGKIGAEAIGSTLPLLKDFATLLGDDVPAATKVMAAALADPAKGVEDLNALLGEFDANTAQLIKDLQAQGDRFGAQKLLIQGVKDGLAGVNLTLSDAAKGWTAFGNIVSNVWTGLGSLFARGLGLEKTLSLEDQLAALNRQKDLLQQPGADLLFSDSEFSSTDTKLKNVQIQIDKITAALKLQEGQAARTAANLKSFQVQQAVETALPEVRQAGNLENQLKLLQDERTALMANDVETAGWQQRLTQINTAIGETVRQLGLVKSAQEKINDDISIGTQAAKARTVEDRAQVEFARARTQAGESEEDAARRAQIVRIQAATAEKQANDEAFLSAKQTIESRMTENALIGKSAGFQAEARANLAEQHRLEQVALRDQGDASKIDMQQLETIKEQNKELAVQVNLGALRQAQHEIKRETQVLGVTEAEAQIAERRKEAYPKIGDAIKSNEAAQIRFNNAIKQSQELAGTFISTFVQGLVDGKSATEALGASLKGLGSSITQIAGKNIASSIIGTAGTQATETQAATAGTGIAGLVASSGLITGAALAPATAGISLAVGAAVSLLGNMLDTSKQQQQTQQAINDLNQRIQQAIQTNTQNAVAAATALGDAAAGPTGNFEQKLNSITDATSKYATATLNLGGTLDDVTLRFNQAISRLHVDGIADLQKSINEATGQGFLNQAADVVAKFNDAIKALTAGGGVSVAEGATAAKFLQTSLQSIVDQNQLAGASFQALAAAFPGYIDGVHEFQTAVVQVGDSIVEVAVKAQRTAEQVQSASDDLFARLLQATFDQNTLAGKLTVFDFDAQRQRLAEAQAGGENMALLEEVLAAERLQIIDNFNADALKQQQDANDKLLADQQQAEQERIDTITKANQQILDYLNGLLTGADSLLSPRARLAAAQAQFNQQLLLAQGGNLDALQGITSVAETLRTAAQAFYGSSRGYVDIFNSIQGQLSTLAGGGGATFQTGGWVSGGTPGKDSVPLLAMPGEYIVRKNVAQQNASNLMNLNASGKWGANDNVERLLSLIAEKLDNNTMATVNQTQQLNRESRFTARKVTA
jgi:hypothetical protein